MTHGPTRLAAGLVVLLACSVGPESDPGGCDPCPKTAIVFEETTEFGARHLRTPIEGPLRLARGATVALDVDGDAEMGLLEVRPEGVVEWLEAPPRLFGVGEGTATLGVEDTCDRSAELEVQVVIPAAVDVSATASVDAGPGLLPPAAVAAGVGLLPGGFVILGAVPRDGEGRALAGSLPVAWSTGLLDGFDRATRIRIDWSLDLPATPVTAVPGGAGVTVVAVPAGSASALGLADLRRGAIVDGTIGLSAGGGVIDLAAFARDASGRLLRGFDDQGFAVEVDDPNVAVVGEAPDRTGPLFSLVGLEAGTTVFRVFGHGLELEVPVVVGR